ncbi:MAG: polysaccharide pyruvyl transferase family protein [Nitriliruptoraceae bacterium]|nr:polysaccharide pyruvyl transferase family protein [Nitriliruptoraceae bacterium]
MRKSPHHHQALDGLCHRSPNEDKLLGLPEEETVTNPTQPNKGEANHIAALVAGLERQFANHLASSPPVIALLDFPGHGNVGDSAIWLGERRLLSMLGIDNYLVSSVTSHTEPSLDRRAASGGTILLHGGGNFGDLWPRHQEFRDRIVDRYPHARIIQLPQTLHFRDDEGAEEARLRYAGHPNFHIMYRDTRTAFLASSVSGGRATLATDAALALDLHRTRSPDLDIFFLLRSDREQVDWGQPGRSLDDLRWAAADWPYDPYRSPPGASRVRISATVRRERVRRRALTRMSARSSTAAFANRRWDGLAARRLAGGIDLLSRGRVVITDRLHGHILCLVSGIPHVFLDNSYGKVSAFAETWGTVSSTAVPAQDLEHATQLAVELLQAT